MSAALPWLHEFSSEITVVDLSARDGGAELPVPSSSCFGQEYRLTGRPVREDTRRKRNGSVTGIDT